jgi:hypothetical protein
MLRARYLASENISIYGQNLYGVEVRERNMSYRVFIIIAELFATFQQHNLHVPLPWSCLYIIGLKKTLFAVIFVGFSLPRKRNSKLNC